MTGPDTSARASSALIASFPITPGQPKFIHYGTWEMKSCLEFPTWRFDKQLLETGKRSQDGFNIPPGPNSPVGVLWMLVAIALSAWAARRMKAAR